MESVGRAPRGGGDEPKIGAPLLASGYLFLGGQAFGIDGCLIFPPAIECEEIGFGMTQCNVEGVVAGGDDGTI